MKSLPLSIIKLYLLFSLLTAPLPAFSYESINIAVGEWPPYISEEQKYNGVVAHIITDIFHDIGIQANIRFLPWSRAYNDTSKGMYAASAIWMHKDERAEYFIYSNEVLTEEFVFFHKKSFKFNWDSIADLETISIGGIYGYSYGPDIDEAIDKSQIRFAQEVTTPEQNFKMLLHDRIEIFPFELNVGHSILKDNFSVNEVKNITHNPKPFLLNSSFVLFPKALAGSKGLSIRFNKRLQEIKDNGEYKLYFKKLKDGFYDLND